jgi:hypothetical protein
MHPGDLEVTVSRGFDLEVFAQLVSEFGLCV